MMPSVRVDKGAIKFVLKGADVMCPGLTSKGADLGADLPEMAPVAVYAEGKEHALAVGITKMSTAHMCVTPRGLRVSRQLRGWPLLSRSPFHPHPLHVSKSINKGIAIEAIHSVGDGLWATAPFE